MEYRREQESVSKTLRLFEKLREQEDLFEEILETLTILFLFGLPLDVEISPSETEIKALAKEMKEDLIQYMNRLKSEHTFAVLFTPEGFVEKWTDRVMVEREQTDNKTLTKIKKHIMLYTEQSCEEYLEKKNVSSDEKVALKEAFMEGARSYSSAKWIFPEEMLPPLRKEVMVVTELKEPHKGSIYKIDTRTRYDSLSDATHKYGFLIFSEEKRLIAWTPLPDLPEFLSRDHHETT